jgi:short-subunit dehydrogenase
MPPALQQRGRGNGGADLDGHARRLEVGVVYQCDGRGSRVASFVPRILAQKEESYIVNTASAAGLLAPPGSGVYAASKHAVVAITECLHHQLRDQNAPIGVSVLCPAFVDTGISNSERNRPAELADSNPEAEQYSDRIRQSIKSGKLSAADIARITIDAVKDGRFYILTHPNVKIAVEIRMNDILLDRQPTNTSQR